MIMGELASTGIAEIERGGSLHRGYYSTDGTRVTVIYGGLRKEAQLKEPVTAHATARALLRDLVAETHAHR
jgi:hypothetical protein